MVKIANHLYICTDPILAILTIVKVLIQLYQRLCTHMVSTFEEADNS